MSSKLRVPHTLTLLFVLMALALVATWLVPQGAFDTEVTEAGQEVVVPGTFEVAEERELLGPWELFTAIPRAFADAQGIIFFLFIIGGVLAVIRATGAIDAALGRLLAVFSGRPGGLIFVVVLVFALTSSVMGASAEYVPFVLILAALCRAMRMDTMTAVGMIVVGYGVGYGVAAFNPYTVVVAQGIAEVPLFSGWEVRLPLLLPFALIGAHHVWSYANRVREDPSRSLVADVEPPEQADGSDEGYPPMNVRHVLILAGFVAALVWAVYGIAQWDWYLTEMGAVFLGLGIVAAAVGGLGASETARKFVVGAREIVETALLVGVARGIALVMEDGQILHTIVHGLSMPLGMVGAELAAVGMMVTQSVINLFVPSGSGQAFVTMPLMAPLGDLVGVTRQVAVLAYQFGDGLANMIIPTNAVLMGILGMAAIPYDRWFRFCFPLILKLMAAAAVVMVAAVVLGFS